MKTFFNKQLGFSFILGLFFVGILFSFSYEVYAQTTNSVVTCGLGPSTTTACKVGDIGPLVKGLLGIVITIGLPLLFIFVAYRFVTAWFALQQGNANAYKDALSKAGNAIVGFLIVVVLVGGGLYALLSAFGVDPRILQILKLFSEGLFEHTYAASGELLPNFTPKITNLYDFILNALRLVMQFFIYPALIVIWVWTGFSFVLAQGAPDALKKAKSWLLWAFITTLVIMVLQGFLVALRVSALKIIGTTPVAGQVCKTSSGGNGQMGTDGVCYGGR